jgi:general stress protein YciG
MTTTEGKQRRGFASMTSEKQREIASKGGRAAHVKGTAHEWTPDEARSAGRKGAHASRNGRSGQETPVKTTPDDGPGMPEGITADSLPAMSGDEMSPDSEKEASGDGFP